MNWFPKICGSPRTHVMGLWVTFVLPIICYIWTLHAVIVGQYTDWFWNLERMCIFAVLQAALIMWGAIELLVYYANK